MTAEHSPKDNDDRNFDAIFQTLISDVAAEREDPLMQMFLLEAERRQQSISGYNNALEQMAELNHEWRQSGIHGEPVNVSGKLRLTFDDYLEDDELGKPLETFDGGMEQPLQKDEHGYYVDVIEFAATAGDFEASPQRSAAGADGTSTARYDVAINLLAEGEIDPSCGSFYMRCADIVQIVPHEPSVERVRSIIRRQYGPVAEQIAALPEASPSDRESFEALRHFTLTIDWSQYPSHDKDEKSEALRHIEAYLTDYIALDTATYLLEVRDLLLAINTRGVRVPRPLDAPTRVTGKVAQLRLILGAPDTPGIEHYEVMLEVMAPAEERGSGEYQLFIPVKCITGLTNLRNKSLFAASSQLAVLEQAGTTDLVIPEITEASVPSLTEQAASNEASLVAYAESLKAFWRLCQPVTSQTYETLDEAEAALTNLLPAIEEFIDTTPDHPIPLEASGEGVVFTQAEFGLALDQENTAAIIQLTNLLPTTGDVLTVRQGIFTKHITTGVREYEEDGATVYQSMVGMVCTDISEQVPNFSVAMGESGVNLYEISPIRRFVVHMGEDSAVTLPGYERLAGIRTAIDALSRRFADDEDLRTMPGHLRELHTALLGEDTHGYRLMKDSSLIAKIGEMVGGDEEAADAVCGILHDMLAGRYVQVNGDLLLPDGETKTALWGGKIDTVISTTAQLPTSEPMLVFGAKGQPQDRRYVPLSTITELYY